MSEWRTQLLSVIACCLLCGVVTQLLSDGLAKTLIRMLCTLVIALGVLEPLSSMDFQTLWTLPEQTWNQAERYVTEGRLAAGEAESVCIVQACESYILEKAKALGVTLTDVTVTLNEELCPAFVRVRGAGQEDSREKLREILMRDLGIPKEQQSWIWNQDGSWGAS